jgi:transposase
MSSLVCGLDVHKNSVYATVMNYGGKVIEKRRLRNDEVVSFLGRYPIDKVAMESSTSVVPVYRALRGRGYEILVSHPKKTRLIAESRIKTDRVDSWAVTELARLDALPLSYMPPDDIAALREKVRRRAFLVRMRGKLKVKIKAQLTINGLTPPSEYGLFTVKGLKWLRSLQLDAVDSYLPVISTLDIQVGKLSRELRVMAPQDEDVKLLMTIPSIGYYSALLVKSEIGSVDRFPDGEKLCAYAGLTPSVSISGKYRRHGSITKEGSRWLRWIMVECVHTHLKYDTSITRAYHAIAERKGTGIAKVAAARRLLMCCYSVLQNRKPYYDPAGGYQPSS